MLLVQIDVVISEGRWLKWLIAQNGEIDSLDLVALPARKIISAGNLALYMECPLSRTCLLD